MKYTEQERLEYALSTEEYWPINTIGSHDIHPTAIIGKNGFGYVRECRDSLFYGMLHPMPHRGCVVIEEDVSIGAHTCIDRAVEGATRIGRGTKIDNLVHVGHGAQVGEHVLIVAGAVLGGSCEIGDYSYIGMGALIKNKIKVGKNCTIGMGAVVTKDVPDGETWIGNPARKMEK